MSLVVNLKSDTGLVDRSENTTRFYEDIRKYPTLSREEEIEWFDKMRNGATSREREYAREYIIKCNQRLAVAVAKKWATTETLMDYTNEVNIGLMEAIDSFDPSKGVKFCSYAMWYLKRAINRYNNEVLPMVRRTNNSKTFHVISKATNEFIQKNERNPSNDELMDIVNTKYKKDVKDKNDLLTVQVSRIDINDSDGSDDDSNYGEVQEYNKVSSSLNAYEGQSDNDFNKKMISSLLCKLPKREQEIIKMRFGLCDDNGLRREHELCEIAEKLGITSERVRQLESEALAKLKKHYINRIGKLL